MQRETLTTQGVFTGYRTDKTLVFTDDDCDKKYNITQELSANDFEKVSYFNNEVSVPANKDQVNKLDTDKGLTKDDITIQDSSYKRLRLAYDNVSDVESLTFSYKDASGQTIKNTLQLVSQDTDRIPPLANGTTNQDGTTTLTYENGVIQPESTRTVKSASGQTQDVKYKYSQIGTSSSIKPDTVTEKDANGNTVTTVTAAGKDAGTYTITKTTTDSTGATVGTQTKTVRASSTTTVDGVVNNNYDTTNSLPKTVYVFENESDWADWSSKNATGENALKKYVPDDAMVMIKETGDLIFGKNVSDQMSAKETSVAVNYDKNSFSAGELKPEYYYDCVDNTGVDYSDLDGTIGSRLVYNRSDIAYDINYTVAVNQNITVNLQANEIFDSSAQQDMKDLTSVITNTQDAYEKREKIAALMKDSDYQDDATQKKLSEWYTAASKEYDYYNDYMQETFERVLGNTEDYLNKANLAETTLGCRGDELKITKTRMDEQQESVTELKSKNDNLDLSTIMMNYTAYYTAYQASLVAAGKLGEQSLLNYI